MFLMPLFDGWRVGLGGGERGVGCAGREEGAQKGGAISKENVSVFSMVSFVGIEKILFEIGKDWVEVRFMWAVGRVEEKLLGKGSFKRETVEKLRVGSVDGSSISDCGERGVHDGMFVEQERSGGKYKCTTV